MRPGLLLPLLLVPAALHAQVVRADFETRGADLPPEWRRVHIPDGGEMVVDSEVSHGGRRSLRLQQGTPGERAVARIEVPVQGFPDDVAAVRLTGWVRTRGVGGRAGFGFGATAPAYLALRQPPTYARGGELPPVQFANAGTAEHGLNGTMEWTRLELTIPVLPGARSVIVAPRIDGTGTAWFDDIEVRAVPARAFPPPSAEALAYANTALDSIQAHVLGREDVDWLAFRARVLTRLMGARTPAETYPALRMALASLNPHSTLQTPEQAAAATSQEGSLADAPGPTGEVLGRFGYLVIPAFSNVSATAMSRYAQAAHALLAADDSAGVCGYVVDLRGNTGGTMLPMLAAAGPLLFDRLDEEGMHYVAGNLHAEGDGMVFDIRVDRPARTHLDAPVAVLVSPRTASSGEATLLRFVGRPNTRTFGLPTAGYTTGNEAYAMPDHALLIVTTEVMKDRNGRGYGGPIAPDEIVETPPAARAEEDPAVQRATAWLAQQPGCRP